MIIVLTAMASAMAVPPALTSTISQPANLSSRWKQLGVRYETSVSLDVSPSGTLIKCNVTASSGVADVDRSVCEALRSAKYTPALSREGGSAYGRISTSLSWPPVASPSRSSDVDLTLDHLPPGATIHPHTQLALTIDEHGDVKACDVQQSSGVEALDKLACTTGTSTAHLSPVNDEAGHATTSVQPLTVGFAVYAKLVLKKNAAYAVLGDSGPYFPERAQRLNVGGYADLSCVADATGNLGGCTIDEESVSGFGFGAAALRMAQVGWMRVVPGSPGPVLVRVDFPRSGSFRAP